MLTFNRRTKIFVCKEPTDMRASYDTLFSKAGEVLKQDPFSGHLFLFINKMISTLGNARDNGGYDRQGLLLLSYPAIESFTLSNF